jgi:very-short-patch-repair endonuclease
MENIKCKECDRTFKSVDSVRRHRVQKHGISAEQTYVDYVLSGVYPTCKCGCGEQPNFLSISKGYVDYILGHASRVNNNWGHNQVAIKKSHETQKKMYESGELVIWNKGLDVSDPRVKDNVDKMLANPNRGGNISKALSGVEKSDEHKRKLVVTANMRWSDPKEREKQRFRRLDYFANKQFNTKSKLEEKFEFILSDLGVTFTQQFRLNGYLYDFYIQHKNLLIEVDGDWYHFNKDIHKKPLSPIQENTIKNDRIKTNLAKEYGYNLIRFWENDINNNPENVISTLKVLLS